MPTPRSRGLTVEPQKQVSTMLAIFNVRMSFPRFSWGGTWSTQQTGRANALASSQTATTSDLFCLDATRHTSMRMPSCWTWTTMSVLQRNVFGTRPASRKHGSGTTWHSLPARSHLRKENHAIAGLPFTGRPADRQSSKKKHARCITWSCI